MCCELTYAGFKCIESKVLVHKQLIRVTGCVSLFKHLFDFYLDNLNNITCGHMVPFKLLRAILTQLNYCLTSTLGLRATNSNINSIVKS